MPKTLDGFSSIAAVCSVYCASFPFRFMLFVLSSSVERAIFSNRIGQKYLRKTIFEYQIVPNYF